MMSLAIPAHVVLPQSIVLPSDPGVAGHIRELLSILPGDIASEVDFNLLLQTVIDAERAEFGATSAIKAVIARANDIFPDMVYRFLAVKALSLVLGFLSHAASPAPAPAPAPSGPMT